MRMTVLPGVRAHPAGASALQGRFLCFDPFFWAFSICFRFLPRPFRCIMPASIASSLAASSLCFRFFARPVHSHENLLMRRQDTATQVYTKSRHRGTGLLITISEQFSCGMRATDEYMMCKLNVSYVIVSVPLDQTGQLTLADRGRYAWRLLNSCIDTSQHGILEILPLPLSQCRSTCRLPFPLRQELNRFQNATITKATSKPMQQVHSSCTVLTCN